MKTSNGKQLAKKMLIAMICGLACGFGCIMLREHLVNSGQTVFGQRSITYSFRILHSLQQLKLLESSIL